jgi:hypothetical protein
MPNKTASISTACRVNVLDVANKTEKDKKRSITSVGHAMVDIQQLMSIISYIARVRFF